MKKFAFLFLVIFSCLLSFGQNNLSSDQKHKAIHAVINQYSEAREKGDTILLKKILTADTDQLVSTGEWRNGIGVAVQGMQQSSATNPGTRTLEIDRIRMLNARSAIVDCRYEIKKTGGINRRMWSTFIVIKESKNWKITAIRNMLPSGDSK